MLLDVDAVRSLGALSLAPAEPTADSGARVAASAAEIHATLLPIYLSIIGAALPPASPSRTGGTRGDRLDSVCVAGERARAHRLAVDAADCTALPLAADFLFLPVAPLGGTVEVRAAVPVPVRVCARARLDREARS